MTDIDKAIGDWKRMHAATVELKRLLEEPARAGHGMWVVSVGDQLQVINSAWNRYLDGTSKRPEQDAGGVL